MKTMAEMPVQEIKDDCQECGSLGRRYFNTIEDLTDYMQYKFIPVHDAILMLRQFNREEFVDCVECGGRGFIMRRV